MSATCEVKTTNFNLLLPIKSVCLLLFYIATSSGYYNSDFNRLGPQLVETSWGFSVLEAIL